MTKNQTDHSAIVRLRSNGEKIEILVWDGSMLSGVWVTATSNSASGTTLECFSNSRTERSASASRPFDSKKRTDSGNPWRTTRA